MVDHVELSRPLRVSTRPDFETGQAHLRVVDLFSGCGGITLGVAQAAHKYGLAVDIRLAIDFDSDAAATYQANFPKASVRNVPIEQVIDGALSSELSNTEAAVRTEVGKVHALVGGPPCQGHSDLNNHTRRDDPKNAIYARMARAAEVFEPDVVFIENVPAVRHDKNHVLDIVLNSLRTQGYAVAEGVYRLERLGVPQRRRRHIVLAIRSGHGSPDEILGDLDSLDLGERSLRWAIEDLAGIADGLGIDQPPRASATNVVRMNWLLENDEFNLPNSLRPVCHQDDHSYKSMYGRLRWDEPAQTITSGFGSIGQGRYMHPDQARALTPHEAARIQGFPDYFQFDPFTKRAALATMIGNAVPPALPFTLFSSLIQEVEFSS